MPVARIPSTGGASLMILSLEPWDCEAWRTYPGREVAELHTQSRLLMRGYWADRYFLGERVFDTPIALAQRRVPHAPPRHMCLLEGLTREDLEARLPEVLEYTQERKTHRTAAYYRAEAATEAGGTAAPAGLADVVLGDVPFPPGMEVVLDPSLGLGSGIIIPADLRQAPPPVQPDPEHTTHVPAQRYHEICQRFGFARSYIGRLYSDVHEWDLEIGRLRRHQSRQSSAVSRLQAEVERLRTRLEAPPPVQLDPEHTTHVPAQRYHEICQRFGFARSYIGRLYSDVHEWDLEIGRLRRHQSRQSSAVSRLQAEVERLRTRLEVKGILLDSSDEDEDGSSSDGAPPSPPHPAVAGPSCRRR
ncbi:hypothetical protein JCGZ_20313 [Jatropha curcas]|uniref:Aminotransferase-like plant mobile domain-containing protein n=1 Tax=Jatropha curcas TaxID=180498 RepID=A0A067K5K5_JATCU|nr:hypothetical protein JCGZ_20313 [Jatropha curcas]